VRSGSPPRRIPAIGLALRRRERAEQALSRRPISAPATSPVIAAAARAAGPQPTVSRTPTGLIAEVVEMIGFRVLPRHASDRNQRR
jgi:hypothetical protein